MRATWDRIESRLRVGAPQVLASLQPGATDEQIAETEKLLGVVFPEPVRESYRIHDGQAPHTRHGLIDGWEFLSLDRMEEDWGVWMGLLDADDLAGRETETQAGVRPGWWNPGWIPLIYGGTGDTHCLDLDPAPGGDLGQIITMWHDSPERQIIAPSFAAWLGQLANALEAGRNFLDDQALVIWVDPSATADQVLPQSGESATTPSLGNANPLLVDRAPEGVPPRYRARSPSNLPEGSHGRLDLGRPQRRPDLGTASLAGVPPPSPAAGSSCSRRLRSRHPWRSSRGSGGSRSVPGVPPPCCWRPARSSHCSSGHPSVSMQEPSGRNDGCRTT